MRISDIRLGMLRAPLKTPFKTALRSVERVEDVVVTVRTDGGLVGYGSAPATAAITGETHGSIIAALRQHIAPRLLGRDIDDLNGLCELVQTAIECNSSAKAAADIALHDLWGQIHAAPLYRMLGGGQPHLTTDITISVDTADKMVADALAALARGFTSLKIKVGKDIADDVDKVKAIDAAVAGRATLRLDANQGWTPKQAVRALRSIEDAGIALELVEQPVRAHDLSGLRYVTSRVQTPVMADESVFCPTDVIDLIRARAADIVNIKLMKAGGISGAVRIADICAAHDLECMIGCMLESSIAVAAAAHVAVAKRGIIRKVDLDVPSLCAHDPVASGVAFDGPMIRIGDAPGLGIRAIDGLAEIA